jgi:hypothetical protein
MDYRQQAIERFLARSKDIKFVAEETLTGETLLGIYLVGDITSHEKFNDLSEVNVVFHIDGDGEDDPYLSDQLTIELELASVPDIEDFKATVQYFQPTESKIALWCQT